MNAPTNPAPTLAQRLRFIDLSFEVVAQAGRMMPCEPSPYFMTDERLPERNLEREALIRRLRIEAMEREGLPMSLLGDGKTASERHFEEIARLDNLRRVDAGRLAA